MPATVIQAPAGLGKTRLFAKMVAESTHTPIEVYAPTHRLAEEWRDTILKINHLKRITIIRGRNFVDQAGVSFCRKHKMAEQLSVAGFAVYPNLCKQSQGKDIPPVKCEHYDNCTYINQFQYADVYIYTHAHLPLERSALEDWEPYTGIIDESFFQSCIQQVQLPLALLTHQNLPEPAKILCRDIAAALSNGKPLQQRILTALHDADEYHQTLRAIRKTNTSLMPSMTARQQTLALKRTVSFAPIQVLLEHLAAELNVRADSQSIDYDPSNGEIIIHHRRPITRFNRDDSTQPGIYILDASASIKIIERFFTIGKIVKIETERNAHIIQCHSTRCSTTSLVPARNKVKQSKKDAQCRLDDIQLLIARQSAGDNRVLVVGPSAIVGNPRTNLAPLIQIPPHCELAHFNALRGIDCWKEFEIVVVVGRNEPPIEAVQDMARALFYDDPRPLVLADEWSNEVRGYRIKGQKTGVEVNVHHDVRVQAVVEQLREQESMQALDRLRLVHSDQMKTVILLSNIPLDLDVDELRTWDEVINDSRLERAWVQSGGVLPLNSAWLAANFPTLWKTEEAAKQDVRKAFKKGGFSNSISIRKVTLFAYRYKTAGQRRWSTCLAAVDDIERVLGLLIGEPVQVRPM